MRAITSEEQRRLQGLSKRAQPLVRQLLESCFYERFKNDQAHGRVTHHPKRSLALTLELIEGGSHIERPALVRAFTRELNISPASAQVEASTVIAALEFGRLAQLRGGRLTPTPNDH
jgi:hypothetical protein